MSFIRNQSGLILSIWALFVWGGRLRNLADQGIDDAGWSLPASILVVGMALIILAANLLSVIGRQPDWLKPWRIRLVQGVAIVASTIWLVRVAPIAAGGNSAGFIVVHVVLASITWFLSFFAWNRANDARPISIQTPN